MPSTFAQNLTYLCRKANISPGMLAKRTGLDPSTLYRQLEPPKDGKPASRPRMRTLVAVADYFGVPSDILCNEVINDLNVTSCAAGSQDTGKQGTSHPKETEPIDKRPPVPLVNLQEYFMFCPLILGSADVAPAKIGTLSAERWIHLPPVTETPGMDIIAARVSGEAMSPILVNDDIIFIEVEIIRGGQDSSDFKDRVNLNSGDLVVAFEEAGSQALIRRLAIDETGTRWLVKLNNDWPGIRMTKCRKVLGKIIAKTHIF